MTRKPRKRVEVFRLSQEEYHTLTEACERLGARNLSDFTRSQVLPFLQARAEGDSVPERLATIEKQVEDLQTQMNRLIQGVPYADAKPRL